MTTPDRESVLGLLRTLSGTCLAGRAILAGSSGVFAASETLPALTEDADVIVDAEWLAANEGRVLDDLGALGFRHEAGTCTFVGPDGASLDLIGASSIDRADRIGGGARVPVMVFGDLSEIIAVEGAVVEVPGGGRALSPAALAASKLLTVRLEKGPKDKLQALLVIDERREEPGFREALGGLLGRFARDRVEDALADAQAALLSVAGDPERAGREEAGYAPWREAARRGLEALARIAGVRGAP